MLQALNNLQNSLAYDVDLQERSAEVAYALYVLARNHKASIGDLRYYSDTQIDQFDSPMARAQLAASLALYGDTQRAETTFASALSLAMENDRGQLVPLRLRLAAPRRRRDAGARRRDQAGAVGRAGDDPLRRRRARQGGLLSARRTKPGCCSPPAPSSRATRASSSPSTACRMTGRSRPGSPARSCSTNPIVDRQPDAEPLEAVVTTVAAPAQPLPAGGNGFQIERTYYKLDGTEANVTEAQQNERYVVVLNVNQLNDWVSRVLVTDLLPAGFEIDNPSLVNSASLSSFPWLAQTEAAHLEFRDDRFVAAFNRDPGAGAFLHAGLCGPRRDAGRLRASGGERRGHVPAGILGAHRLGHDGGEGALT